jgi:hypothetical protein
MSDEEKDKVIDFVSKRQGNIENKRRNFERLMFQNVMGAYSVIAQGDAIHPITMVNISKDGCMFRIPWRVNEDEKIATDSELSLRMYFSKKSYIPVVVKVVRSQEVLEDGRTYMDYGCMFDKSLQSFAALEAFIDFLYKFAEYSAVDQGSDKVFFL